MMKKTTPILVITGPTASGKSSLAVELALAIGGEIVSADSMQIYTGMSIGSARITKEEMKGIPHHLLDFIPVTAKYSVADYKKDALTCIEDISKRGKLPILCGGTGLYINTVLYSMAFDETAASDPVVRNQLQIELDTMGKEAMYMHLAHIDPKSATNIHPNNTKRVLRALEVYRLTGKPFSSFTQDEYQKRQLIRPVAAYVGISWPKEQLDRRIAQRVQTMLDKGLVDEVHSLQKLGASPTNQAMQGLGYKQLFPYLDGKTTLEEAKQEIVLRTRQYAKRQMTWFRRDNNIQWLDASELTCDDMKAEVLQIMKCTKGNEYVN